MTDLPQVGDIFEGYEVEALIGAGNMGTVFRVRNPKLGRNEALKIVPLPEEVSASKRMEALFQNEVSIAATVHVPNVVTVFDGGRAGNLLWFTMTLISGNSLGTELAEYPPRNFDKSEVMSIGVEIATALDRLAKHEPAVIHGDVKPSNIVVERDSSGLVLSATLVDFGVSTATEIDSVGVTNRVAGSLPYMAPEIFTKGCISSASDEYAFACTIFELLQGYKAFPATDAASARQLHCGKRPVTNLGAVVDSVFAKALAVDTDERYESCNTFISDLIAALNGGVVEVRNPKNRKKALAAFSVVACLGLIGGGIVVAERSGIGDGGLFSAKHLAQPVAIGGSAEPMRLRAPDLAKGPRIPVGDRWTLTSLSDVPIGEKSWQGIQRMGTFNGAAYHATQFASADEFLLPFRHGIDEKKPIAEAENDKWRGEILDAVSKNRSVAEPAGSEVVKLRMEPDGRRLDVLQTSGSFQAVNSEGSEAARPINYCLVQPAESSAPSSPEVLRPVFVVLTEGDPCPAAYDTVAAWAMQTTTN